MANKLVICGKSEQEAELNSVNGLNIAIENGNDNQIKITEPYNFSNFTIKISGSNNVVQIEKNAIISNSTIDMGVTMHGRRMYIGEFCRIADTVLRLPEENNSMSIGNNCIIKYKCHIRCDDGHVIFNPESKEVLNRGGKVEIGNHVFVGQYTFIGKNVSVCDDVVILPCSVIVKSVEKKNVLIGGNPAKIIREDIGFTV